MGQVKHKAEDAVDAIGGFASDAGDRVKHLATDAKDFAIDAKGKALHFAEEAYDQAGDKLGTMGRDMTDLVKKYPIQALLIGFGAGLLLGRVSRA